MCRLWFCGQKENAFQIQSSAHFCWFLSLPLSVSRVSLHFFFCCCSLLIRRTSFDNAYLIPLFVIDFNGNLWIYWSRDRGRRHFCRRCCWQRITLYCMRRQIDTQKEWGVKWKIFENKPTFGHATSGTHTE